MEWLNLFLEKFWLLYEPVLSETIVNAVNPVLQTNCPVFLEDMSFTKFTLGSKSPRIENLRTFGRTEQDIFMFEVDVSFVPADTLDLSQRQLLNIVEPKVELGLRVGKGLLAANMPVLVEDISLQGRMRIKIKLYNVFPHIQLFEFSFLEPPVIDYELKPIGGETFGFDVAHVSQPF